MSSGPFASVYIHIYLIQLNGDLVELILCPLSHAPSSRTCQLSCGFALSVGVNAELGSVQLFCINSDNKTLLEALLLELAFRPRAFKLCGLQR